MSYEPKVYRREGGDSQVIAEGGHFVQHMTATAVATAGAATYTTAAILGGIIARDPAGGARTDVTPTAALLIAGLDLQNDGESASCYLVNTADQAEAITIDPGAGVTVANAGQTLAQNESALLLFVRTSSTAVTLYILGA